MFLLLIAEWLLLDVGHSLSELSKITQFFMMHSTLSKLRHFSCSAMGRSSS